MKRRQFIRNSVFLGATATMLPHLAFKGTNGAEIQRIGITTVIFRNRFRATSQTKNDPENELALLDVPEFFSDRFGVHNLEFWSRHFESVSTAYLNDLSRKMKKYKCKLTDIQVDTKNDLSDPDEEKRKQAIAEMKDWIDVCSALKSEFVRISPMKKSYAKAVESVKELNAYAKRKGVKTLVENHGDLFSDVGNHLNIRKDIPDKNMGLLADFGNYPDETDRYGALEKIAPYTRLISAKAKDFSKNMEHLSYDFGKCVRIFENAGYKGIYSLEQWGKPNPDYDYEKIVDWMIMQVKQNL